MAKLFSVEEIAAAAGLSARAVRLYLKKGLLCPQRAGRVYVFTEHDLSVLQRIQRLQRLGYSLQEIKDRHGKCSVQSLQEQQAKLQQLATDVDTELKALKQDIRDLTKGTRS